MASIVWMSVFLLLVVELFITFLLVLPFPKPVRRFLAKKIFTYDLGDRIRVAANFIFLGLMLAIADAVTTLRRVEEKEEGMESSHGGYPGEGPANMIAVSLDKQRKFRAERNMYLAGFALTLGFVITRLIELIHMVVTEEEKQNTLNKRIDELEKRASSSPTEDSTEDQPGTPMETMSSNPLSSGGLRRRTVSGETESTTSTQPTSKDD